MLKSPIKPKAAARAIMDPFETLTENFAPMGQDILKQMGADMLGGFGGPRTHSIGHEDLSRARKEKELKEKEHQDNEDSQKKIQEVKAVYREHTLVVNSEQGSLKGEVAELQTEVVKLA